MQLRSILSLSITESIICVNFSRQWHAKRMSFRYSVFPNIVFHLTPLIDGSQSQSPGQSCNFQKKISAGAIPLQSSHSFAVLPGKKQTLSPQSDIKIPPKSFSHCNCKLEALPQESPGRVKEGILTPNGGESTLSGNSLLSWSLAPRSQVKTWIPNQIPSQGYLWLFLYHSTFVWFLSLFNDFFFAPD